MKKQKGSALIFTLIVLVAMLFGTIALFRTVDMGTVQAGNMAFKESSVGASDIGVRAAMDQLQTISNAGTLDTDIAASGSVVGAYYATQRKATTDGIVCATVANTSASNCTNSAMSWGAPIVVGNNSVYYVIDRMCSATPGVNPSTTCLTDIPYVQTCHDDPTLCQNPPTAISYRITVKIVGPSNTETYVQTSMSMSQS